MNLPEDRIIKFIKKHHVMTLSTCVNNELWTAHCFYAYMKDSNTLIFSSDLKTKHAMDFQKNPNVSGGIVMETKIVGKIQGIQFKGIVSKPYEQDFGKVKSVYLKRFPYAVLVETTLWKLDLNYIKMTDNNLGFGKKLIWSDLYDNM
ncbi:MAG: hypothetical protein A2046_00265 [Bacteroidetes bacterium GWA2_30_7]|nr:MAG: hypothetical protein A2046_00265 [Bacteroidetes bacterium GWA2_30_7]